MNDRKQKTKKKNSKTSKKMLYRQVLRVYMYISLFIRECIDRPRITDRILKRRPFFSHSFLFLFFTHRNAQRNGIIVNVYLFMRQPQA